MKRKFFISASMENSKVIHLVSNSLKHPENTATNFKISYDVPFDLRGKKLALVDASFTKMNWNIVDEEIVFHFPGQEGTATFIIPNLYDKIVDSENLSQPVRISKHLYNRQKEILADISGTYDMSLNEMQITILNKSPTDLTILYAIIRENGENVSWNLKNSSGEVSFLASGRIEGTHEETVLSGALKPKQKLSMTFKPLLSMLNQDTIDSLRNNPTERALKRKELLNLLRFVIFNDDVAPKDVVVKPKPGYYETVQQLVQEIQRNTHFQKLAKMEIKKNLVQLTIKEQTDPCTIVFKGIKNHLGFEEETLQHTKRQQKVFLASHESDMSRGLHHFYVYCSLAKPVAVNERHLHLMATLDAHKGIRGKQVTHNVRYPLFIDCVEGIQQMVEVTIADDTGNSQNLLVGRTKLTLAITA